MWRVIRIDDNGNSTVMFDNVTESIASAIVVNMSARGHKQTYVAEPIPNTVA